MYDRTVDVRQAVNASGQTKKKINPTLVKLLVRSAYALLTIAILTLGVGIGHNVGMRASQPSEDFGTDGMPAKVYVNGVRWAIVKGDQDNTLDLIGAYGVTDCKQRVILIHGGMTLSGERDTLLHELFHAHVCINDVPDNRFYLSEDGHGTIAKTSQYIQDLFHDNQELALWFIKY